MKRMYIVVLLSIVILLGLSMSTASAENCTLYYTVQSGDWLSKIARQYGLDWKAIARSNHLTNPDKLRPGQVLCLKFADIVKAQVSVKSTPVAEQFVPAQSEIVIDQPISVPIAIQRTPGPAKSSVAEIVPEDGVPILPMSTLMPYPAPEFTPEVGYPISYSTPEIEIEPTPRIPTPDEARMFCNLFGVYCICPSGVGYCDWWWPQGR